MLLARFNSSVISVKFVADTLALRLGFLQSFQFFPAIYHWTGAPMLVYVIRVSTVGCKTKGISVAFLRTRQSNRCVFTAGHLGAVCTVFTVVDTAYSSLCFISPLHFILPINNVCTRNLRLRMLTWSSCRVGAHLWDPEQFLLVVRKRTLHHALLEIELVGTWPSSWTWTRAQIVHETVMTAPLWPLHHHALEWWQAPLLAVPGVTGAPTQTRARAARVRRRTTIQTTITTTVTTTVVSQDEECMFKIFLVFDVPVRCSGTLSALGNLCVMVLLHTGAALWGGVGLGA